jgi:type IX secretion system PorP/SprF family membrane protein
MKKSFLIIAIAFVSIAKISAQDEAIFGHYMLNPVLINPALSGQSGKYQLFGHLRNQWTGFAGQPKTYALSFNGRMTDNVGLSAELLTEKFALTDRMRTQLGYAYHFENAKKGIKGGFGFSTEFHRERLDRSVYDNALFEGGDRLVEANTSNVSFFDATAGGYAILADKFLVSIATPNLIRARLGVTDIDTIKKEKTLFRQVILLSSYKISMDKMTIEPSLAFRKVYKAPFEVDLNLLARFLDDKFIVGVSMRPGDSGNIGLLAGTKIEFFKIYYSYNSSLAEFKAYNRQAHEVTIGLEFNRNKQTQSPTEKKKKRYTN